MCIRDREKLLSGKTALITGASKGIGRGIAIKLAQQGANVCLLYTSDAADERSSVDLGGRRIIKKKKQVTLVARAILHIIQNDKKSEAIART